MKTLIIILSCFFLSSCFFLFHLVYSEQKSYQVGNKDRSIILRIDNRYPVEDEREGEYNKWINSFQQGNEQGDLIERRFLFYLGDSTKYLYSVGLNFKKVKLEFQDTIFNGIRFYSDGSNAHESFIDILEKDQKIYRVFEGQTTIGEGFKEVKIKEIR